MLQEKNRLATKSQKHVLTLFCLQHCDRFTSLTFASETHQIKTSSGRQTSDKSLQVVTQPFNLIDEEVDVGLGGCRVGDHHTEEVDFIGLRLVAHHGGP